MKFHTIGNYGVVYRAEISLFAEGTNIERIMELKLKMLVNRFAAINALKLDVEYVSHILVLVVPQMGG